MLLKWSRRGAEVAIYGLVMDAVRDMIWVELKEEANREDCDGGGTEYWG